MTITMVFSATASNGPVSKSAPHTILKLIEQINKSDFPYNMQCEGGQACFLSLFVSSDKSDDLLHQCAVDICGPPDKNPKFILDNTSFSENLDPAVLTQFDEKVAPVLRANLDHQRDSYKKALDDLEELKVALNKNPEHPEWSAIVNEIMLKNSVRATSKKGTPIKVTYKNKTKDMDPQNLAFIHSYLQRENALREKIASTVRNQETNELKESVQNQIHATLKDHENTKPADLTPMDNLEIRFLTGAEKQLKSAPRSFIENLAIEILATAEMKNTSCLNELCRQAVRQQLDIVKGNIEKTAESAKEQHDEIHINRCKSNFIEKTEAVKHTQTFRDNLPKYKEKILTTGLAPYSVESRQQFENYIDNTLQIDMPNTDVEKEFRDYVSVPVYNHNSQTRETLSFGHLQQVALISPKYNQICPTSRLEHISDMFHRDQHKIEVSFVSCALHDHGKGILAHEIGHAISLLFKTGNTETTMSKQSTNKYQKLRACATKRYKNKTFSPELPQQDLHDHQDDRFKTEEDTADLFSYMVFQDDPKHHQCAILQTSIDGSKYKGIKVLNSPQMIQPHSTPFLRVLMEAIHKRTKLSSACQKVINKYKNKIDFKPCF